MKNKGRHNHSHIFTDSEMFVLENRLNGIKKDINGLFSGRIKPKIEELLNIWLPKKAILKKVIERGKKKNGD